MCSKFVLIGRRFGGSRIKLRSLFYLALFSILVVISPACVANNQNVSTVNTAPPANANVAAANTNNVNPPAPSNNFPITLPVLDAMFADESFAGELKSKLGLTDEQIQKLQENSRNAVLSLDEADDTASTTQSAKRANDEVVKVIGEDKTRQLFDLVRQRWSGSDQDTMLTGRPNAVPTDSRIVVNAPAYRMDVYRDGKLTQSYKVGIGYPEFPLPRGLRQAKTIIFNPAWTPPDEPWVKGKFAPGKKVEAGSKDNPLGPIKIPIGLPSLIHGGKNPAKLGTFASHGCVGLTNQGVEMFAQELAQIGGTQLTAEDIKKYQKDRSKTEELKLSSPVPVELRYETIVVEDGKVHIYRDVYELGTNTEENLRKVLAAYDVNLDDLDANVKQQLLDGLTSMAVDAKGNPVDEDDRPSNSSNSKKGKITTTIKGKKDVEVIVPQLAGKGYPAPVNLVG
jgi:lipoprotein-anchoring transpeptidase ErfK/SrfK